MSDGVLFRFAHPWVLGLLVILIGVLVWKYRQTKLSENPATLIYSDTRLMNGLPVTWRVRIRRLPDVLRLIAWIVLVIALARPQQGSVREVIRGQGIDIVLALDISGSMAALDFAPGNRLDAAKTVISDFIAGREYDRIGLVVFARNAFQQAPLTLDYVVLTELLNRVKIVNQIVDASGNPVLLDGTAMGLGMASAALMLRESAVPSKVIVLLTDGNNNTALDPITAAQALAALDIRVYTIGMGKPGQIPMPDQQGNIVYIDSDLDEGNLSEIAKITGGLYFRAEDTEGLQQIYDEINRLERSRVERQIFIPWQDTAWGWMIGAVVLLLLERLLRYTLLQTVP